VTEQAEQASPDTAAALARMLDFLSVEPIDETYGRWRGQAAEWFGPYLFGGFVIAQAIMVATRSAPTESRLHSLHAYFLRPVRAGIPIDYDVADLRAGRSFTTRRVTGYQDGKPVLEMSASLTADTDGYVYDLPVPEPVPAPDELEAEPGPGPWIAAYLGPTPPAEDDTRQSTHRMWFRVPARLPDDVHLHAALLGFATDWTGVGGRPLHLEGDTEGMISLDHAAWFHRPARADQWLFYDVQSLVNAGGRGLLRGVMRDTQGRVVASVSQEMRLIPPP
jgi:acyl-CoA thioesterase-2